MHYSPLRYPGGKGKLAYYLKEVIKLNNLIDGHYIEPYAGGAGAALELLIERYVSHIYINDIDKAIYSFWKSVLYHPEELCKRIFDTPVNMLEWNKQRSILKNSYKEKEINLGFATFFLNRTNRSGILNAGVIGGKEQSGDYTLDARYSKKSLIKRIENIASYKDYIHIYNMDAINLIDKLKLELPNKQSIIYLDPPYYEKGKSLYRNFYNHDDHVKVQKKLDKIKSIKWLASYDDVQQISDMYFNYRKIYFNLRYTAQMKRTSSEIIVCSNNLTIPVDNLNRITNLKRGKEMFIRAYLRASTDEQDATRAKNRLIKFADEHNNKIASYYVENISGSKIDRPELNRLIDDSYPGDILLVEQIDRLTRLSPDEWEVLKRTIQEKNIQIVALDLPSSYIALTTDNLNDDEITSALLKTINQMIMDMLAVFAYKDYADRKRRQAEGIKKAKKQGKYKGRKPNVEANEKIIRLAQSGYSTSDIAGTLNVSISHVKNIKRENKDKLKQIDWVRV